MSKYVHRSEEELTRLLSRENKINCVNCGLWYGYHSGTDESCPFPDQLGRGIYHADLKFKEKHDYIVLEELI